MSDLDSDGGSGFGGVFRVARYVALPIALAIFVLVIVATGSSGVTEIEPGEVAVVYNTTDWALFGPDRRVVREQGTLMYMPVFQRVETVTIEPQILVMEGSQEAGENHTYRLDVRAKDGSSFWFDRIELHYQVIPAQADAVIEAYGLGEGYKTYGLPADAREVLRDEFGRYPFTEVADPSKYGAAITAAKEALNQRLNPYGITVTQIITQKPRFQAEVEKAIEDRQNALQEVEVQREKRTRLLAHKDRMVQDVKQKKNAEYQELLALLAGQKKEAENNAIQTRREADKYYIETTSKCFSEKDAAVNKAQANAEAYKKQAEGLKARVEAVGARGPDVLNLEIAQRIFPQLVKLKAVPYSRNAAPAALDLRQITQPEVSP